MAYAFNGDRSKYDLTAIAEAISELMAAGNVVVEGTTTVAASSQAVIPITNAALEELGIEDISDYVVTSAMFGYEVDGSMSSWRTDWGDHLDQAYQPAISVFTLPDNANYGLRVYLYNILAGSYTFHYRVTLAKVNA